MGEGEKNRTEPWPNARARQAKVQWASSAAGAVSGVSSFCAVCGSVGGSSKAPTSLPEVAAVMKFIQIGRAARAPVSFAPSDRFSSKPTQTPQVIAGEKPTNKASVKSLVV